MNRRELSLTSLDEVRKEVNRLHEKGYDKAGNWDLAQVCDHLRTVMDGSLDGAAFKVPWIIKTLFGRLALNRIMKTRKMMSGIQAPKELLPSSGRTEEEAIELFQKSLKRVEDHQGDFHPSPFFGYLTPQQWRDLHMIHGSHHLAFLLPKG